MYYYNSTIRVKQGCCPMCDDGKKKPLMKGLCEYHYQLNSKLGSMKKALERDTVKEPGLPELIEEADAVFSRYVRLKAADDKGMVKCFTCKNIYHWKRMDCGHFISRGNHYLMI